MRFNLRIKKFNHTVFLMISESQTLEGIASEVIGKEGKHYVFADIENCSLEQAVKELEFVQNEYNLSDILIFSDRDKSFRAWCFTEIDFRPTYIGILNDIPDLDWNFFYWTVKRGYATLRYSNKKNRPPQKVVAVLHSYYVPFPEKVKQVIYDTGVQKRGLNLIFKDGKAVLKGDLNG